MRERISFRRLLSAGVVSNEKFLFGHVRDVIAITFGNCRNSFSTPRTNTESSSRTRNCLHLTYEQYTCSMFDSPQRLDLTLASEA